MLCLVTQSCLTLCDPMDCSLPGSSVHGIFQARMEWVVSSYSRGSSWPKDGTCITCVSCITGGFFTCWAIREHIQKGYGLTNKKQIRNNPFLLGASTRDPTHDNVMRRRPDRQGGSGLQGFRKAAPVPTLKMTSVFLMLAILDHSLISVTWVKGLPRSLSKQNQLRTLINMSPGQWYPIRLSRMKGVFQFRPLCWHSSLLGKCILKHMTAHTTLIINSIKNLIAQKALIGTEPFGGWGSPIREHKNIILKVVS